MIAGPDGMAARLWSQWPQLADGAMDVQAFVGVVSAYRRELWLRPAGDRVREQCCPASLAPLEGRVPQRVGRSGVCVPARRAAHVHP